MAEERSLFQKFKKGSEPPPPRATAPAPAPQAAPPAPQPPVPGPDAGRLTALETALGELKKELEGMRSASGVAAPVVRLALPPELAERLTRSESAVGELRRELAAQREELRGYLESSASKDIVKAGEARLEGLEKEMAGLAREVQADREIYARLERSENYADELRRELAGQREALRDYLERSASREALKVFESRLSGLESGLAGLSGLPASERALALRLEKAEAAMAEMRNNTDAAHAALERRVSALPDAARLDLLRGEFDELLKSFETVKKSFASYSEEFSGIERECRKALGDVQGYARSAAQKNFETGWEEHLKDSVKILSGKLADVETGLRTALADMAGRLAAGEALYRKITASVEERLKKAMEPETKALEAGLSELRGRVSWLTDEYKIVMERKIRALEGQKGAFEAISKRMDSMSEDLKKSKC